jgi:hypothetical protein
MATAPIRTKRWTRLEYEGLVGLGAFGPGDRIELVGGDLLDSSATRTGLYFNDAQDAPVIFSQPLRSALSTIED